MPCLELRLNCGAKPELGLSCGAKLELGPSCGAKPELGPSCGAGMAPVLRFSLAGPLCPGGVEGDLKLKLDCGAELSVLSPFLKVASPHFRDMFEDVAPCEAIKVWNA